ncbi:MAG: GntR family transcriptional regulator [Clostridia bacterium]
MKIDFGSVIPVYQQIANAIEDDIISGKLLEGQNAYSQISISKELGVNPATAGKGIKILVDKEILVKQRGLSMTVAIGATAKLLKEKKENSLVDLMESLIIEAEKIGISKEELIANLGKYYEKRGK